MEVPQQDQKEEKYVFDDKSVKFFSTKKLIKFFLAVLLSFFAAFGLLFFIDIAIYPEIGVMELAMQTRDKTELWRRAKENDLGHEAIAFENMLDAYVLYGGDISHALDTLTDEFTAANWAELLEYDVDYFQKHEEVNDSVKTSGMLHVVKLLYSSGHYDLFKHGYKILVSRFSEDRDFLTIYAHLIQLDADFDYDDEEEREELQILYELELRRHLKLTANKIVEALNKGSISSSDLGKFAFELKDILESQNILVKKSERFRTQIDTDLAQILVLTRRQAKEDNDPDLLNAGYGLVTYLAGQKLTSSNELAKTYL